MRDELDELDAEAHPRHDTAQELVEAMQRLDSGEIFRRGLHETVQHGLQMTNQLGMEIAQAYHFG